MKKFLDDINSSADIKKLNIPELEVLAGEIRQFLIENISKSGGHLSSNLGTVELTLALHKVFDFSADKILDGRLAACLYGRTRTPSLYTGLKRRICPPSAMTCTRT